MITKSDIALKIYSGAIFKTRSSHNSTPWVTTLRLYDTDVPQYIPIPTYLYVSKYQMSVICKRRGKGHYNFVYTYWYASRKILFVATFLPIALLLLDKEAFSVFQSEKEVSTLVLGTSLYHYHGVHLKAFLETLVPFFSTHLLPLDREIETSSEGICYLPPYSEKGYVGYVPHEESYVY